MNTMRQYRSLVAAIGFLLCIASVATVYAQTSWSSRWRSGAYGDAASCINMQSRRGTRCGNSESLEITVQNGCDGPVFVRYLIEAVDGTLNTGTNSSLSVSSTRRDMGYECTATGRFLLLACHSGDECSVEDVVPETVEAERGRVR